MNTDVQKCYWPPCPWPQPDSKSQTICVHLCSSVVPLFFCRRHSLPNGFEEANGAGGGGVERLDAAGHGDAHAGARRRFELGREPCPFRSDEEGARPGKVGVVERSLGSRRERDRAPAVAAHELAQVGALDDVERE